MNKLGIVFGIAAAVTIAGCKDPNYIGPRTIAANEPKNITTESTEVGVTDQATVEEPVVEAQPVEEPKVEPEYTLYTVVRGDSLSKISKRYNIKIDAIKKLNNMTSDTVRLGQKLKLPGKVDVPVAVAPVVETKSAAKSAKKSGFTPYTGETKEYVVKSGDTLGAIAYGNGINIRQLKELNSLKSDVLKIGQKLKIPAGKVEKVEETILVEEKVEEVQKVTEPVKVDEPEVKEAPIKDEPAPIVSDAAPETYVVQEGDDVTGIALRWGTSVNAIREANNLAEDEQVTVGQIIKLPAEAAY